MCTRSQQGLPRGSSLSLTPAHLPPCPQLARPYTLELTPERNLYKVSSRGKPSGHMAPVERGRGEKVKGSNVQIRTPICMSLTTPLWLSVIRLFLGAGGNQACPGYSERSRKRAVPYFLTPDIYHLMQSYNSPKEVCADSAFQGATGNSSDPSAVTEQISDNIWI